MQPSSSPAEPVRRTSPDIVGTLPLETKVALLSGRSFWRLEPLHAHGLESIEVTDGPHGLRQQRETGDHLGLQAAVPATCFPTAVTLGSSWDVALLEEVGAALGEEAVEQGVSVILGPGLNIKRHPAGGRCFEYLSEDPLLSGKLAAAMVRGIQSQGVGACLKHFAVNNQEAHRLVVDAVLDERTLREIYLTGFEIAVKESAPWTVMCSYNLVNGTYASDHHELLTAILRDEWGFDGLVMSDWGATNDRVAGIRAGMDLEMPGSNGAFDPEVIAAVCSGDLDEGDVDRCAARVVDLLARGQRGTTLHRGTAAHRADRNAHHQLARRAAAAGSVLLCNEGVLPLDGGSLRAGARLAVVGELAAVPRYQGAGSSQVNATRVDVALDVLRARVGEDLVTYAPGFDATSGATTDAWVSEAVAAAADADVAVVFAGLPAPSESEGFDRSSLDLPDGQIRVIEALASASTPVVVVLNNGGVVHMPWADRVDAVLECWLGGQAGGSAVVDVLLGDAEPGGRLAESIPVHVAQLPADHNFPGSPRQVEYREGPYVGYRFHESANTPAQFPFGFGLSYTTFEWSEPELSGSGTDIGVHVTVGNTGDRAGSDVVQVYVRRPDSVVARPDRELKAFTKVHLGPGERRRVDLALDRRAFAVWDVAAGDWLVEGGAFEIVIGRSSADAFAAVRHEVASDDVLQPQQGPSRFVADDAEFAAMLGHPIPAVPPRRPFNRNSTLEELEDTAIGRLLAKIVVREGHRRARQEFPDPDPATIKMVESALREGPARGLVLMSGGVISFRVLDGLLDALNGRWSSVAGRLRPRRRADADPDRS